MKAVNVGCEEDWIDMRGDIVAEGKKKAPYKAEIVLGTEVCVSASPSSTLMMSCIVARGSTETAYRERKQGRFRLSKGLRCSWHYRCSMWCHSHGNRQFL